MGGVGRDRTCNDRYYTCNGMSAFGEKLTVVEPECVQICTFSLYRISICLAFNCTPLFASGLANSVELVCYHVNNVCRRLDYCHYLLWNIVFPIWSILLLLCVSVCNFVKYFIKFLLKLWCTVSYYSLPSYLVTSG